MFIHSHILSKTIVTRIQTEIGEVYTRFHIKTTHKLNHTLKGRHILIRQILGSTFPSPPPPRGHLCEGETISECCWVGQSSNFLSHINDC